MYAIYNNHGLWENVFDSIEEAQVFVDEYCGDWDYSDFEDFMIVEIVPKLEIDIPPKKIIWKNID